MPNPTIREVARAAGVAPATASLALRNHPRLRKSTCEKVQRVAQELGYKPNAVVSNLLAQLRVSRTPKYQATLALINPSENPNILAEIHTFREWVRGMRERATQLGYGVNEFWLNEKGVPARRLAGIFRAQNIRGVIVAASLGDGTLPTGFDEIQANFACVVLGTRSIRPALHLACDDQFATVRMACERAVALGYRRPALVMCEDVDELVGGRFSGGFLSAQNSVAAKERVPPFYYRSRLNVPLTTKVGTSEMLRRFKQWYERQRPDVILCIHPEVREWLAQLGATAPRDVGLIHLDRNEEFHGWAGMRQNNDLIGAAGVDILVGQLHRNELGVPSFPKCIMVESTWVDGNTVRRVNPAAPKRATRSRR
jgi:LacI family transcriptional regulator